MKLLPPVVALTLLVGAWGRASGSKRPHHQHHTAALLGVRKATVSLDAATDKLQGVVDAVSGSINQVLNGYVSVKGSCVSEYQASAKRLEAQAAATSDLETKRQLNIERTAGLEASLSNLINQETDAHASYESSVSQRAGALQKHMSTQKSTLGQAKAIGDVLEMMKKKRAAITASQTSTDDMKVVPPTAPTSSGSGLDYVIGVLNNIQETQTAKAEEGSTKHNEDDADLERLVTSYKTSLQHIDKQYQAENARRMEAKVTARDAGEEKTLRNMLVDGENKLDEEHFGLCGADGKGGSVPAAIEAADYLLSKFKQQTTTTIGIMDNLPDLVTGAASFLSVETSKYRGSEPVIVETTAVQDHKATVHAVAQKEVKVDPEAAQESAARWVIEQAKKFKDNTTQHLAQTVAASFPHGVPPRKMHRAKAVVPSQQLLHTLVGTNTSHQSVSASKATTATEADPDSDADAAIIQCVKDKQELTDKIIEARRAARGYRTDRMSAEARVTAVKSFRELVQDQQAVLTAAQDNTEKGFKPLREYLTAGTFSTDLADAVTEMDTIQKDVDAYIAAGGPPASAGLPTALKGIKETLNTVKSRLQGDMTALDGVYTGALMISYPALINQLVSKEKDLKIEGEAMADAVKVSDESAKAEETKIKDLMTQRAGAEYRCLQAGTCANLHYQQCCSGAGTNMKKVGSWKECADHCEAVLKEKKSIAGCHMTNLYKEDDRSGSGTCYAQTACTLQSSDTKCAGSLCKPLPA